MKTLKLLLFALLALFASCSTDDQQQVTDELQGLALVKEIANDTHIIEIYSASGTLEQGYNAISVRIKDVAAGQYETNAEVSWMPLMHMSAMQHSCPFSAVMKTVGKETLYDGYIVFQMAANPTEYWTLDISYSIGGAVYSATGDINVAASAKRRVASFTGSDGSNYVVAMIEPSGPRVGLNDMAAGVYKMVSMMHYLPVENFTVKIDPRMPGMGNHGSPNNVDLTQSGALYRGTLSLTMTGYWKINLQLLNQDGEVLKGEAVSDLSTASSIFFEVEF
jgi:hypothetical protein